MPVNKDPKKKRPKGRPAGDTESDKRAKKPEELGQETERDREYELADAEWKNLWDQTEVIDMDKW
jgi:hypothetical protein